MERISGREITEWQAFEQVHGPINSTWQDEASAVLIEEMRKLQILLIAVNTERRDQHKVPRLERYERPDGTTPGDHAPGDEDEDTEDLGEFDDDTE